MDPTQFEVCQRHCLVKLVSSLQAMICSIRMCQLLIFDLIENFPLRSFISSTTQFIVWFGGKKP